MLSGWPGMVFPLGEQARGCPWCCSFCLGTDVVFQRSRAQPPAPPGVSRWGWSCPIFVFSGRPVTVGLLAGTELVPAGTIGAERINPIRSRVGSVSPCGTGEGRRLGLMLTLVPSVHLPGTEPSRRHRGAWKQPGSVGLGRSYASVAILHLGAGLACLVSPCVAPRWKTDPKCPWDPPRKQALAQQHARKGLGDTLRLAQPWVAAQQIPCMLTSLKCRLNSQGFNRVEVKTAF